MAKGNEEKGILPADTVRLAYSYAINADELGLGTAWKMAKDDIEFFLKEMVKVHTLSYMALLLMK